MQSEGRFVHPSSFSILCNAWEVDNLIKSQFRSVSLNAGLVDEVEKLTNKPQLSSE